MVNFIHLYFFSTMKSPMRKTTKQQKKSIKCRKILENSREVKDQWFGMLFSGSGCKVVQGNHDFACFVRGKW